MPFQKPQPFVSDVNYVFRFGKHVGETLEEVLDYDPYYIIWAHEKEVVLFSPEIYEQALASQDHPQGNMSRMDWGLDYGAWMDEIPF